ncbi:sialate O-acetylesterase [uncultured Salegentibacter sp.]|uniref:sialate O-acetylesterase n=1 Tax=uncultured Salegentibacter sp. TaxID=259320 RepID=UPI0025965BBC|nr:sialate O-acetylesterase [uncultured Salegentibacter sp.]
MKTIFDSFRIFRNRYLLFCFAILLSEGVWSQIRLPAIISDNMVLQQNQEVVIWGWTAKPAEDIAVWGSWDNDTVKTSADKGKWRVTLTTPAKGGPFKIFVKGHELISIDNILIGEVWLASGQSNMEMTVGPNFGLKGILDHEKEIAQGDIPSIRFFIIEKRISNFPQDDCFGEWVIASPETIKNFSAVAYFFGRNIHERLEVPVGIISSSWGGTNAETWMPENVVKTDAAHTEGQDLAVDYRSRPSSAGEAYNAMIYPLIQFKIKGAIFYQGENNRYDGGNYHRLFSDLIRSWRLDRKEDFPFYYTQIAPYDYGKDEAVLVREGQLKTLALPSTGMAVINDIGNLNDIHPREKKEVGRKLSLWALAQAYGQKGIVYSGPLYKSMSIEVDKIRIEFHHAEDGLQNKGGELTFFEIAGEDGEFLKASARIEGNTVVVSNEKINNPVAVRFAFSDLAEPTLFNKAGLPASAFRTDNGEIIFEK